MSKNRSGFAVLMLLVVVVIGFLIYYAQFASLGGSGARSHEKPEDQPWAKESSLKDPNAPKSKAPVKTSSISTLKITEPVQIQAMVKSSPDPRGQMDIRIDPNGTVTAKWLCKYSYTHAAYNITADVTGNTDPASLYTGPDGKTDRSKLFFIARGTYSQQVTNLESGEKVINKGTLYINGYLNSDHSCSGKLSMTGGKNWHFDYTFDSN